jgi:NitT/TauT family transport system substrate-binding protein
MQFRFGHATNANRARSMNLTRAVALSLIAAASATRPAFSQSSLEPLRIATPGGDSYAEPFFGTDMGFFAKAGFEPQIQLMNNAGAVTAAVSSGAADVGLGDMIGIANAIEHGIPLGVFAGAGLYTSSAAATLLCGLKTSPYTTPKDLEGQTVAVVTLVGLGTVATKALFSASGADLEKIRFIELPQPEMLPALQRGTIAAAVLVEPFLTAAKNDVRIIGKPYDALARTLLICQWIASRDWLTKNSSGVKRLVGAIYDTARWANTHHTESLAILVRYLKIDPERMRGTIRASYATSLDPSMIQPVIDGGVRFKAIPTALDASSVIVRV